VTSLALQIPADIPADMRAIAQYAAALLHSLARDEHAGRRSLRLTGQGPAVWSRFRGRLGPGHLLGILLEDTAVLQQMPFAPASLHVAAAGDRLDPAALPSELVEAWLAELGNLDLAATGAEYIQAQARLLGLPTRLARADLHQVKSHQKVLELPGTGGQLAHHIVTTQGGLFLQDNFQIACASWQEMVLAGLIAADVGAPNADFVRSDPRLARARADGMRTSWDFVVGLAPDRGLWEPGRLKELFPNARIVLV
jgi:hypothetical protein